MKTKNQKAKMRENGGEQMSKKEKTKKIQISKISMTANRGITLIALVVTIVVLIILATISIYAVLGENGIIKKAEKAKEMQENATIAEEEAMNELFAKADSITGNGGAGDNDDEIEGVKVKLSDGSEVTLTKANVADYLGKIVTNYTGQSTVEIEGTEYTVSPTYRLYYVDFNNKYKDGKGTIYLKAECTYGNYQLPTTDTSSDTETNIKIRTLNPSLYAEGVTSPDASNANMKAVTFLTNTTNWSSLADTSMTSNINYIVGSPSLEMMVDSYNTHYKLTGETPDTSTLDENTARVKLFYQYPYTGSSNNYGYRVGPCNYGSTVKEYYYYTSKYSVKTDSEIDTMYYPGERNYYWLASPGDDSDHVMIVDASDGGLVYRHSYDSYSGVTFCPVVSLKSSVQLQLQ